MSMTCKKEDLRPVWSNAYIDAVWSCKRCYCVYNKHMQPARKIELTAEEHAYNEWLLRDVPRAPKVHPCWAFG